MTRTVLAPVLAVVAIALAAPACAQSTWPSARYPYGNSADVRRLAYDRGFQVGARDGERDARSRDAYRYQDERAYQRADSGYDRRYGSIERYRTFFREGYVDGYAQGYRRYGRQYGDRNDRYGRGPGYGYPPVRDTRYLTAYDNGVRDGIEKGREDARDRDRFDPRRHRWYRDAERGYDNRFGSREQYRDEYRRGFLAGYEQGYRGR
jgi:hypothetical protein